MGHGLHGTAERLRGGGAGCERCMRVQPCRIQHARARALPRGDAADMHASGNARRLMHTRPGAHPFKPAGWTDLATAR